MRPQGKLRAVRSRTAVIGALTIGICSSAAAPLLPTAARAQSAPAISVADPSLRYGERAVVRGTVGAEHAGRPVSLEFGSPGTRWHVVQTVDADRQGRYAFRVRLPRSGQVRAATGDAATVRATASAAAPAVSRSASRRVTVAAMLPVPYRRLEVLAGRRAIVKGVVRPGLAGRVVRLEALRGGRWRAVDSDRTDARGRYALAHRTRGAGSRYARVTFPGDSAHGRAVRRIGRIHAYRAALASRYDLYGGPLGCGGTLGYDSMVVAHKTLPCGTRVRIRYRGRVANATVRDRGPYVGGREYDLAGAVARKLGFNGVGTVYVTK